MREVPKAWETIGNEYHTDWRNIRNLCDNVYFGRNGKFPSISPFLSDDQQVVLEQLCQIFMKQSYKSKMQAVYIFIKKGMSEEFLRLDREESNQVLAAFAELGMANA